MRQLSICLAIAALSVPLATVAQTYPEKDKPVKFIVAYPAGGPIDTFARFLAQNLTTQWNGSAVVVENRPGANGIIATEYVAKSAPDGYNVLTVDPTTVAMNPALYSKLPYDADKDFAAVINLAQFSTVMFANTGVPANTLGEFVALAKAKPASFNYGSFGTGSFSHFATEEFSDKAGIKLNHVPYKGAGDVIPALMGGHIDIGFSAYIAAVAGLKAGKVKPLAIASAKRLPQMPDVPTFTEAGYPFINGIWTGAVVRAGTPKPIVDKLAEDLSKAVRSKDFQDRFVNTLGFEVVDMGPDRFTELLKRERLNYAAYVKKIGVKLD